MLLSLAALPVACGALEAFSPAAGLTEALVLAVAVWLPSVPVVELLTAGAEPVELVCEAVVDAVSPAALGVVVFDCEAGAVEDVPAINPVVLDAWLLGFALVALVSALLGFVAVLGALEALGVEASVWALGVDPALTSALGVGVLDAVALSEPDTPLPAVAGLLLLLPFEVPALALMVNCSFTCLTPATDFAISFARFLSAFEETLPVSIALPLVTETCTLENAGS